MRKKETSLHELRMNVPVDDDADSGSATIPR